MQVLGSGGDVIPNVTLPVPLSGSRDPAFQWQPSQGSTEAEPSLLDLEPKPFRNRGSLTKWQRELKLPKECLPDLSTKQSGPFLFNGARRVRWTFIHHLLNQSPIFRLVQVFTSPLPKFFVKEQTCTVRPGECHSSGHSCPGADTGQIS